jgi:uncharacterized protein (DUF305 family)
MRRLPILLSITLLLGITSNVSAQATGPYDASTVMFAQMMIPHHQQAVVISKLALKQGSNSARDKG